MASVYKKRGAWWFRFRDATGVWRDRSAKASTKAAARLEALAAQQLAHRQRDGLAPSSANVRRTFGELMDLWCERYGRRLRSQTIIPMGGETSPPRARKAAAGGRRGCAGAAPHVEGGRAVAFESQPSARLRAAPLHRRVAAIDRVVATAEPGKPRRTAQVQGTQAQ